MKNLCKLTLLLYDSMAAPGYQWSAFRLSGRQRENYSLTWKSLIHRWRLPDLAEVATLKTEEIVNCTAKGSFYRKEHKDHK
jgi:hypothetical protein